jgi:hypothetical protein
MKIQFVAGGREVARIHQQGEALPRMQDIVFVGETSFVVVDVEWALTEGTSQGYTGARVHLREMTDDEVDERLARRK